MVLLIDDDKVVRGLITSVLEREGMRIDVAADGADAIAKLRERSYRAILLDLLLPKSNGLEVLRFLKREQPSMLRRVVIVSAVSDIALRSLSDRDSLWGVVQKPFDIHHLVNVVRECRAQSS